MDGRIAGRRGRWWSLDGSAFEYLDRAIVAGVAPYLRSLAGLKFFRLVEAALPSFTNPNNVSIVTGVPPAVHGISGNIFLDRDTGETVMMNDASYLEADTILSAFSRAGDAATVIGTRRPADHDLSALDAALARRPRGAGSADVRQPSDRRR